MYFLLVNLYEFGQFLRIFLWISLPMMTIAMLVTTYLHYRRRRGRPEGLVLSVVDGYHFSVGGPEELSTAVAGANQGAEWVGGADATAPPEWVGEGESVSSRENDDDNTDRHNENMYRGILWMKEKYEQYRDLADKRYEDLRTEMDRTEKRYQDLLVTVEENKAGLVINAPVISGPVFNDQVVNEPAINDQVISGPAVNEVEKEAIRDIVEEKDRQIHFLQGQLEQRIKNYHQLEYEGRESKTRLEELEKQQQTIEGLQGTLAERQQTIDGQQRAIVEQQGRLDEMEGYLHIERSKVDELVAKLQSNSLLLMNIYKELDKSLNLERPNQERPVQDPV